MLYSSLKMSCSTRQSALTLPPLHSLKMSCSMRYIMADKLTGRQRSFSISLIKYFNRTWVNGHFPPSTWSRNTFPNTFSKRKFYCIGLQLEMQTTVATQPGSGVQQPQDPRDWLAVQFSFMRIFHYSEIPLFGKCNWRNILIPIQSNLSSNSDVQGREKKSF